MRAFPRVPAAALVLIAVLGGAATTSWTPLRLVPGDTLWGLAQRYHVSVGALERRNGLHDASIYAGQILQVPGSATPAGNYAAENYVVRPGDTLTALAGRFGTSVGAIASANHLGGVFLIRIGQLLRIPAGTPARGPVVARSALASDVVRPLLLSAARAEGVDPSLVLAVAWQESGWQQDVVSGTGAVGVMQIEPATWSWINSALTPGAPLDPGSAVDNVRGGVLLLRDLVAETGSDALAAAAYYQGLQSVREHGVSPNTQQYVNAVLALQSRFGG